MWKQSDIHNNSYKAKNPTICQNSDFWFFTEDGLFKPQKLNIAKLLYLMKTYTDT